MLEIDFLLFGSVSTTIEIELLEYWCEDLTTWEWS